MFRYILVIAIFSISINAKDVSVFGAGNSDFRKPYNVINIEKVSQENRNSINKLKLLQETLEQRLQGISSVYEHDSKELNSNKNTISNISNNFKNYNASLEKLNKITVLNSDSIIAIEKKIDEFISEKRINNMKIQKSLLDISTLLNKINKNHVSNTRFEELVSFVNAKNKTKTKILKKPKESAKTKLKKVKLTNEQKFQQAVSMVSKNRLTASIPLWDELLKDDYKPAQTNFYLGEVRFGKKEYKQAIYHYKTSMILYDEADYIPRLLLHSAISFDKINDKDNAKNFFNTLIDVYSTSKEAKEAKKLVKNIK